MSKADAVADALSCVEANALQQDIRRQEVISVVPLTPSHLKVTLTTQPDTQAPPLTIVSGHMSIDLTV